MLWDMVNHKAKKDILVFIENINAKVGSSSIGRKEIIGTEGIGNMDENDE